MEILPYEWSGPYAEMRAKVSGKHDPGLCASVRAAWMPAGERLILRTCEIVGYENGYLYDDHIPTFDPDGRGDGYEHISFGWDAHAAAGKLSADCVSEGLGKFSIALRAESDYVDIRLGLRNDMREPMGRIDWHFCAIGYESESFGDPGLERTFIYDGSRLCSLSELSGGPHCEIYFVAGGGDYVPSCWKGLPQGPITAGESVIIVEDISGKHSIALGFKQSRSIFSNPDNMCFHADPYFAPVGGQGEERHAHGRLYMIDGTREDALDRYRADFGGE